MGQSVSIQEGITDENVTRRAFMAHAAGSLSPTAERKNKTYENKQGFAHFGLVPPEKPFVLLL
jgi:hypothetical protein